MSKNWPAEWGTRPRYVTCYRGKPTFEKGEGARRVMAHLPSTDRAAFEREYHELMAAQANGNLHKRGPAGPNKAQHRDTLRETVGDLATLWFQSPKFALLDHNTARAYKTFADRALLTTVTATRDDKPQLFGQMKAATMLQVHAIALRSAIPTSDRCVLATDHAYRDRHMVVLRNMFHWALGEGGVPWVQRNPFARLKPMHPKPKRVYAWREENWQKFLKHHPLGSVEHLAMTLMRYMMVRVSDLAHLGAANGELSQLVRDRRNDNATGLRINWIEFKNSKSRARPIIKPRSLKVHSELLRVLEATPGALDRPTFLISRLGAPYKHSTIGEMFNRWCKEAGVPPQARSHGMRRGGAVWLAEHGATLHQIKSMGGWEVLSNVQRYTGEVDQGLLADHAVDIL